MVKALVAIALCLSFAVPLVSAAAPAHQPKAASQPKPAKPDWSELTPAQQKVLAPLQEDWSSIDTPRRKKWVKVADQYPKMKPAQQQRLQAQMKDWARLTPEQRRVAREKYQTIKKLPPDKRAQIKAQWEQYQQSLAAAKSDASGQDAAGATPTQ